MAASSLRCQRCKKIQERTDKDETNRSDGEKKRTKTRDRVITSFSMAFILRWWALTEKAVNKATVCQIHNTGAEASVKFSAIQVGKSNYFWKVSHKISIKRIYPPWTLILPFHPHSQCNLNVKMYRWTEDILWYRLVLNKNLKNLLKKGKSATSLNSMLLILKNKLLNMTLLSQA